MDWKRVMRMIQRDFPNVSSLTTATLANWLADNDRQPPILLDTRSEEEYSIGHLPGAVLAVDVDAAKNYLDTFQKSTEIVVYCSVGYRSAKMASQLLDQGWTAVKNLDGSIFQWANEGRQVFIGDERAQTVHPYDRKWGQLLDRRWHP